MPSTPAATYDDVNLILRLYEMRREEKLRIARDWFSKRFKGVRTMEDLEKLAAPGSEEYAYFRMVTTYWEMVASFITQGVLHRDLYFQSGREMLFVWLRVQTLAPSMRESHTDATAMRNLQNVAEEYAAWWEKESPGAVEAFRKRTGA